jgi:ABC-type glycerol-3-phosphate transport system substrate-binding protein
VKQKRIVTLTLAALLTLTAFGCKKKSQENAQDSEKPFNVYVDIKDKNSQSLIKFLTEEYKKKNPKSKLKVNDVLGGEESVVEDVNKGTEADVIITTRDKMIELSQKGLLSDMGQHYEKNKISEKRYNIMSSYGRVGEEYYGIAILPQTLEIFYNDSAITKLGVKAPTNVQDIIALIKKLNSSNIRVPVILPEDLNIATVLTSIAAANRIKVSKLDEAYDNKNKYLEMKEMQWVFDDVNTFVSATGINKDFFELGNESTISSLINGTSPVIISTSNYYNKLKDAPVSVLEELTLSNNVKASMPVIVDTLLCTPTNAKNNEEGGKFIKFVLEEEFQEALVKKGYITGSKKANAELNKLGGKIVKKLSEASDNSVLYSYSLPKKFAGSISARVDAILSGKYDKNEWEQIVNEVYKK